MNDLTTRILELQRMAHALMCLGTNDAPLYSDDFTRLNKLVLTLSDALFVFKGHDAEEEANLCLALLMGYNASIYDSGNKDNKKQSILDRAFIVLEQLPASLLKARLLTYCYGEVYDDSLLEEAHAIVGGWNAGALTDEQVEVVEELRNMEENGYPVEVVEE